MHAWEAVQKSLDYIEANISKDIQIEELAEIAALSLFYYQRLFTRLVKIPVREYIKLRRLSQACEALRNKQSRVSNVSFEYGFKSHEVFTRAFKAAYGITPTEYKNNPIALENFEKPNLLLNYVMVDKGVPLISEGMVLEYNLKTIEVPVFFLGVEDFWRFKPGKMLGEKTGVSEPGAIWERFFKIYNDIPRIPKGRNIGVSYKGCAPEGYSTYFVGTETEKIALEDASFASWQLPAREYVVCKFEAESFDELVGSCLGKAMKYTRFWLKNHGLIMDGFTSEIYYHDSLKEVYLEMWIPFKERENP